MIKIKRNGKYSIHISFNINDVNSLIEVFQVALEGGRGEIDLEEQAVIDNKSIKKLIITCNNEQDKLSFASSSMFLEMEDEVINYNLDRFEQCSVNLNFYPAELCEVSFGRKNVTIYGFLESS